MVEKRTKYVINIDQAGTKVHLNPYLVGKMWCNLNKEHNRSIGGKIYVEGKEAQDYLEGNKPLIFAGKRWKNIERCKNCSVKCKQKDDWDISKG